MTWQRLSARLDDLPFVLAGPMLRKVDETSVTVWLAMRIGANVELAVLNETGTTQLMTGERRTIAIGRNLHIVAVQARMAANTRLSEGITYRYNLWFNLDNNTTCDLANATNRASLGYPNDDSLPSFSLPPRDLDLLRLIQGSCRKPAGEGTDMLVHLDKIIRESASNPYTRPHQLLLTGDQIYADEVTTVLRMMLTDAAESLLGWDEQLPVAQSDGSHRPARDMRVARRYLNLTSAGFTSEVLNSHVLSLGEYLALYLFVWSPVLWPPSLPPHQDVAAEIDADWPDFLQDPLNAVAWSKKARDWKREVPDHIKSLQEFHATLPEVRRALANVPSYMCFDDHEVMDDWNMTPSANRSVYGSELGLRVAQNALIAFSLCQHWGSVPERFLPPETTGPYSPGAKLLMLLDTANPAADDAFNNKAAQYQGFTGTFRTILGIHDAATIDARDDDAVFHDSAAESLRYNFTVEGPSHQVIFTDTRTWRSYRRERLTTLSPNHTSNLLTRNRQTDQFKEQILDAPATGERLLLVVLTTNVPPVQPIRAASRHEGTSNFFAHFPDLYEAWDLPSKAFDRLLVALSSKLPLDASGQHAGAVVLLSGDVHMSFATRIIYRATKRFEDDIAPRPATAVFAQLVASALKKQDEDTVRFQREDYFAAPYQPLSGLTIRHEMTEGYVGWNFPAGTQHEVGWCLPSRRPMRLRVTKQTIDVTPGEQLRGFNSSFVDLTVAPHYRYRFDYLKSQRTVAPPSIPPLPAGTSPEARRNAARWYDDLKELYQTNNRKTSPEVVGFNNIGEIRIQWGEPAQRKINYRVHWRDPVEKDVKLTTYVVRLDLNSPTDPEFADIKARSEP